MKRIVFVVVAACGSARPPVVTPAPGVPAAPYAGLFVQGAVWRYQVTTTSEMYEPSDPKADASGQVKESSSSTVRCSVAEARTSKAGVMSRIECDAPLVPKNDPLAGAWVADARGLWRVDELPAAGAEPDLADARLVLAATPVVGKHEQKGTGDEEGFGESTEVTRDRGAWCVTYASWGGDESYETLCFAGAAGVTHGAAGWSGGSTHATTFDLVP